MAIVVQKFGGTSVATAAMREHVVSKVRGVKAKGHEVVVVVSAMGRLGEPYATDTLLTLVNQAGVSSARDRDLVMACGELISVAVMASALRKAGLNPLPLSGWQAGIMTDNSFGDARITAVDPTFVLSLLKQGIVPVVAGFQGASSEGNITTLGRGGSDTTAAALGVALGAVNVEIYTDVEGIMTADPRLVPEAKVLSFLDYGEVFQMASQGSKVIHPRAVELAMQRNIPLVVKSTCGDAPGTTIANAVLYENKRGRPVTAVAHILKVARVSIATPSDDGALELDIFSRLAGTGVSVDLINVSPEVKRFIIPEEDVEKARAALETLPLAADFRCGCAKVSVIGTGMRGVPGVMSRVVAALREAEVRILQSSDSHLTISVLIDQGDVESATKALHRHFGLNTE